MTGQGLAPSPAALQLLDLAQRGAEGSVMVGGRRVILRGNAIGAVERAVTDEDLATFLVAAGRLEAQVAADLATGAGMDVALARELIEAGHITPRALSHAMRALWIDRLVRGLESDEEAGRPPGPFIPNAPTQTTGLEVAAIPLVLDALARRATDHDAEVVGARGRDLFLWKERTRLLEEALAWSGLEADVGGLTVTKVLRRLPAGAPRIAALIRAGIAHLRSAESSAPPPPQRTTGVHQTAPQRAMREDGEDSKGTLPPPTVEAAGAPRGRRTPSTAVRAAAAAPPVEVLRRRLPEPSRELDDPLAPLEDHISSLEQSDASGGERAEAWSALAQGWWNHFASGEEATRARREAAAADPSRPPIQLEAARLCQYLGQLDLAVAYARGAARHGGGVAAAERLAGVCLRRGERYLAAEALEQGAAAATQAGDSAVAARLRWRAAMALQPLGDELPAVEATVAAAQGTSGEAGRSLFA